MHNLNLEEIERKAYIEGHRQVIELLEKCEDELLIDTLDEDEADELRSQIRAVEDERDEFDWKATIFRRALAIVAEVLRDAKALSKDKRQALAAVLENVAEDPPDDLLRLREDIRLALKD